MPELRGLTALVVEDEAAIALLIEEVLQEFGCEIAASVAHVDHACRVASAKQFDFAVLDVNLAGRPAFPIAAILQSRGIPFVFSTGYGSSAIPAEFSGCPLVCKPFTAEELQHQIMKALRGF